MDKPPTEIRFKNDTGDTLMCKELLYESEEPLSLPPTDLATGLAFETRVGVEHELEIWIKGETDRFIVK